MCVSIFSSHCFHLHIWRICVALTTCCTLSAPLCVCWEERHLIMVQERVVICMCGTLLPIKKSWAYHCWLHTRQLREPCYLLLRKCCVFGLKHGRARLKRFPIMGPAKASFQSWLYLVKAHSIFWGWCSSTLGTQPAFLHVQVSSRNDSLLYQTFFTGLAPCFSIHFVLWSYKSSISHSVSLQRRKGE